MNHAKERYIILDYFVLDMKNKEIKLLDGRISDSFPYTLKNNNLCVYFLVLVGLHCCVWAFSSYSSGGYSPLQCPSCGAQALGVQT